MNDSSERVFMFGADHGLLGIVTLPDHGLRARSEQLPFVVLLNAGLVHRVGPFGMTVQLARTLAARGYRVLRFDQAGLGDSPAHPTAITDEYAAVADGRAAMDALAQRFGATRFVIGGLCSGAIGAHRIALADARVVGLWMLDGYAYPTARYHVAMLARRVRNPGAWRALGRRAVAQVRTRIDAWHGQVRELPIDAGVEPTDDRRAIFYQDWPPVADARRDLERMLARGVRMLFVYSGGWSNFVDARQFDDMFPHLAGRAQIRVAYDARADHTYLAPADRGAMIATITSFLDALSPAA